MNAPAAQVQRVLLIGASGFLGGNLRQWLVAAGFELITTTRGSTGARAVIPADFTSDHDADTWVPRLRGVDIVINAAGIFAERGRQTFRAIHVAAPRALFRASVRAGVRHVVQISALGAQSRLSAYFRSKRQADEYLMTLPLRWTIACPSLVYGEAGASSRFFRMLASLPLIPLPGRGHQAVQPIHVDDFCRAIVAAITHDSGCATVALVGDQPLTLRRYLQLLRTQLGLGKAVFIAVPDGLMRMLARAGKMLRSSLLHPETLAMLDHGSSADPAPVTRLLGHPPRSAATFIAAGDAGELRQQARLAWLLPLVGAAMAVLWISSGAVSLWAYPRSAALALLAQTGMPAALQPALLHLAAAADMLIGIGCLLLARRAWFWLLQMALVAGYTAIITLWLPWFWAHPFGPVTKNIPLLALLLLMYMRARDRWDT